MDAFEIQVYDGTADSPGEAGLELHVNRVMNGPVVTPPNEQPQLPPNHQSHFTLEPSYGLFPFWEVGGYFQTTLREDGTFDYAGVKLRSKFVTTRGFHPNVRLGVNVELSLLPERYDRNRYGGEIRPIAAFENERWLLVVNPILSLPWAGPDAKEGPSFEPALMAKVKLWDRLAVGVEYYAGLGPLTGFDKPRDQEHYLFEAIDLLDIPHLEVNAGVGEGLTPASNDVIVKFIVGYSFEVVPHDAAARAAAGSRPFAYDAGPLRIR